MTSTAKYLYNDTNKMTERILNLFIIIILLIRSDETMARGSPDYNLPDYSYFSVETPISDIVTERQGFSRIDNRGRVLWFEDFRSSLYRWQKDNDAPGVVPIHTLDLGFGVGYYGSVKLLPTGNGGTSQIYNRLVLPVSKILGLEVSFNLSNNSGDIVIAMQHAISDGLMKSASMQIIPSTGEVKLYVSGGQQSVFTPSSINDFISAFVTVKIVADMQTGKYTRLMLGNNQYDISSYIMPNGVSGISGSTYISIASNGLDATYINPVYIGYVIISGDEP
jgi:hypothetical protein